MKVLIVNTHDISGGAARAASRLHHALLIEGIDSQMLVINKKSDDHTVVGSISKYDQVFNKLNQKLDTIPIKFYEKKSATLFSASWAFSKKIIDKINTLKPDVVHLHWINKGMIRVEDLPKINAPIVWSLHDMWALTGGCHYDEECGAYKIKCGECKVLGSKSKNDLSTRVFSRKQQTYSKIKSMTIVGLSKWLTKCAEQSALFENNKIVNLPNPINTAVFKPSSKNKSRELWNLPMDKKLVLFGAMGATSDPRKGFNELSKALCYMGQHDIEFVVFGATKPLNPPDFGCKIHYVGTLSDDVSLVTLYSAADVMVTPSLQENLSNAIMESLACATPVVGFDIGGNSDLIEHKKNGYLAEPFNSKDLAYGIEWIVNHEQYDVLCVNARVKVKCNFDSKVVADKYIELYKNILINGQ